MNENIDQATALAHMRQIERQLSGVPEHILQQARRAQQIEEHNAQVDAAKAKKKQIRQMAKQARIPVPVLKRMISSIKPAR